MVNDALAYANMLIATIGIVYCCIIVTILALRKKPGAVVRKKSTGIFSQVHATIRGQRIRPIRHTEKTLYEMSMRDEGRH